VDKPRKELYFPTQVYFLDLADAAELNAAMVPHLYAWREADREGIVRSNLAALDAWHSAVDMHHRPEYAGLVNRVLDVADHVFGDLGYAPEYEPACDTMWANISPRYGMNRHHTHPNVLWSGVYYVQTPAGCGPICFHDPRVQATVLSPRFGPAGNQAETWSEVYFEPMAGRLLMFPSWLGHEVRPNLTEVEGAAGDRISVSFNLYQQLRRNAEHDLGPGYRSGGAIVRGELPDNGDD